LTALECSVVTASKPAFANGGGPPFYTEGVYDMNYAVPNIRVTGVDKNIGVRFGFWRSVNDSHNPFMLEGFIDEIARQVNQDPYQFRRALLQHPRGQRQLGVLDLAAEKAGWQHPRPGHALGIAAFEGFGSFIATVVDISMKERPSRCTGWSRRSIAAWPCIRTTSVRSSKAVWSMGSQRSCAVRSRWRTARFSRATSPTIPCS
jgi:CO/xanthine dehydrogenase Mo-binding subunit